MTNLLFIGSYLWEYLHFNLFFKNVSFEAIVYIFYLKIETVKQAGQNCIKNEN